MNAPDGQTNTPRRLAWLKLFRVPNLATAGGEAVAGAALALALGGRGGTAAGLAVVGCGAAAETLLYLAGLADNDLVDEPADRAAGSNRPLATGELSRRQVVAARAGCFAAALTALAVARPDARSWAAWGAVACAILTYNRIKERLPRMGLLAMGACRSLSVAAGAALALAAIAQPNTDAGANGAVVGAALPWMVAGWTGYVAAITWLGAKEERATGSLPPRRFAPAAFCLVPLAGLCAVSPGTGFPLFPAAGCAAAALVWCRAVRPLGRPHGPRERGRAVGKAVGALLWMQSGFALGGAVALAESAPATAAALAAYCAACWLFRATARRLLPSITGS